MSLLKKILKRLSGFREIRYFYNALVCYHRPFSYLFNRFFVKLKIRKRTEPLDKVASSSEFSIHFLCGHKYIDLLLWSLFSWYRVVPYSGQVYIHDDGSFKDSDRKIIAKLLPAAKIVDYNWAKKQIESWLGNYPNILDFRKADNKYVFAIKLVDPFFVSPCSQVLVIDVDVLWFKRPDEILNLLAVSQSFMMQGKGKMDYKFSGGGELPDEIARANGGIVGYHKKHFNLRVLDKFCAMNGKDNPFRVIDQAGYAYVLKASGPFGFLSPESHHIKGPVGAATVAKHYTGPRRELFWLEGVKILAESKKVLK